MNLLGKSVLEQVWIFNEGSSQIQNVKNMNVDDYGFGIQMMVTDVVRVNILIMLEGVVARRVMIL